MYPKLEEILLFNNISAFKRIPVCKEIYADFTTPIEVMRILKSNSTHAFLLESIEDKKTWGRYTFLGFNPVLEITSSKKGTFIKKGDEIVEYSSPKSAIRSVLAEYKSMVIDNMPSFTGGLVGYFSYEYIGYNEPKLHFNTSDDFRHVDLMLFENVIAFDNFKQKIYIITGINTSDIHKSYNRSEKLIEEIENLIRYGTKKENKPLKLTSKLTAKFSKDEFINMVEKAKNYIYEGDIFQVVLSNPQKAKAEGSLFDLYRVLRTKNPSPYMFYFASDYMEIAGSSPETLVKLHNKELYTYPLAGSRPRGKTYEEDTALEKELLSDEKEISEHNMLVDLGRNDIGKISKLGTVSVEKYMVVEKYSHIMHIASTVKGIIKDEYDAVDAISSILPAGTLSGAPKIRACEIINELENSPRGIYGGAIGYIDLAGNMDMCIAIRLISKIDNEIEIRTGAGIVYDSIPENEYMECINKAKAVVISLEESLGGIK